MAKRRRKLGRGLEALMGPAADSDAVDGDWQELPLDRISPNPYQPRRHFDDAALDSLADSIRAHGLIQPVMVRPLADGRYQLVAGERRWRACQRAGLEALPAIVRAVDDQRALGLALVENIQRRDLGVLDEAAALRRLVDEFQLTHQQAADWVGRSRAAVSNLMRLLALPKTVRQWLETGQLEMGHARALLGLEREREQIDAARVVLARKLSVAATEQFIRGRRQALADAADPTAARREPAPDHDTERLARQLSERLGAPVKIDHRSGGRGKVTIVYHSLDELDGLLERLG